MVPGGVLLAEVPTPVWLDRLGSLPSTGDRSLRRTGPLTCTFEDRVAEATIAARVLTETEWTTALGPPWTTRVESLGAGGELEWLVVARHLQC